MSVQIYISKEEIIMKKTLALILALVLALSLLTVATAEEPKALKTGLSIVATMSGSKDAEKAAFDATLVAVLVDENGVIYDCVIDSVGPAVKFDATGAITSDVAAEVLTKNEQGDAYNMVTYGGAVAEWYAQADALAQFAVGKTVEEFKTGAVTETGYALEGTDLAAGCTIYIGGYVSAVEAAVNNAKDLGAKEGDELVLASATDLTGSKAAAAEAAGLAQMYTQAIALTKNEGVITSAYIDAVQAKVNFDATGAITTDLSAPVATKNELGEAYGMKAWGGAIAEWDTQAASFCNYITGKTADEVAGIAVNEKTVPTDADLLASVTIKIGEFLTLVEKAMK